MVQEVHSTLQSVAPAPPKKFQHHEVLNNNIYHTYIRTTYWGSSGYHRAAVLGREPGANHGVWLPARLLSSRHHIRPVPAVGVLQAG